MLANRLCSGTTMFPGLQLRESQADICPALAIGHLQKKLISENTKEKVNSHRNVGAFTQSLNAVHHNNHPMMVDSAVIVASSPY